MGGKRDSVGRPRCLRESEEGCSDERRRNRLFGVHGTPIWPPDKVTQIQYVGLPALGPSPRESQID